MYTGKCQYSINGRWHDAANSKIAAIHTSGDLKNCNIRNLDKWGSVSKDLYQYFIVVGSFRSDHVNFTVIPCFHHYGYFFAITVKGREGGSIGKYEPGRCFDSDKLKMAETCIIEPGMKEWTGIRCFEKTQAEEAKSQKNCLGAERAAVRRSTCNQWKESSFIWLILDYLNRYKFGEIQKNIIDFYDYEYDDINRIYDGGYIMYDEGNEVYFIGPYDTIDRAGYDQVYKGIGFQAGIHTGYPFVALMWIEGNGGNYSIQVKGTPGVHGSNTGSFELVNNTVNYDNVLLEYKVFQIYGWTAPTICEVYFSVRNLDWNSSGIHNLQTSSSTATFITTNEATLINPKRMFLGYMLLSSKHGRKIENMEIMSTMTNLAQAFNEVAPPLTDAPSTLQIEYRKNISIPVISSLEVIENSSNAILQHVTNFRGYAYDGGLASILDGGGGMYDRGNLVTLHRGGQTTSVTYGRAYSFDDVYLESSFGYPFIALMWIGGSSSFDAYAIQVRTLSYSKQSYHRLNGTINLNNTIQYEAVEVSGISAPTIVEVYFTIASSTWNSSLVHLHLNVTRIEPFNWNNRATASSSQPLRNLFFGYMLLSKSGGERIQSSEIENVMMETGKIIGRNGYNDEGRIIFPTNNYPTDKTELLDEGKVELAADNNRTDFSDLLEQLIEESKKFKPSNPKMLDRIEELLRNISQSNIPTNLTIDGQLYILQASLDRNQTDFTQKQEFGSAVVGFTLQTDGADKIISVTFAFNTNNTEIAQESSPSKGSAENTKYLAPENTPFIVIFGFKEGGNEVKSQRKRSLENQEVKIQYQELMGIANYTVPSPPPESVCKILQEDEDVEKKEITHIDPLCLFYDRVEEKYSDRGCSTSMDAATGNITCKCNHLTVFTVLMAVKTIAIPHAVKITTYVTESLSIVFLIGTIVVLYLNKGDGDRVPVQINLASALLLLHVINVSHDLFAMHDQSCVASTAANHLFLLCTGMWFLVEGIRLFMATSNPINFQAQDAKLRLKFFLIVGWIVPILMVGTSAPVGFHLGSYMKPQSYYELCNQHHSNTTPIPKYDRCWLAPNTPVFYGTVIAPLALILIINFLIIGKTTYVTLHSTRMRNRGGDPGMEDVKRAAKSCFFLFLMLGGTWSLAFFTGVGNEITSEVFMYIHSVVNGIQGLVVFLIYCIMNDAIRPKILPCKKRDVVGGGQQMNVVSSGAGSEGQRRQAESQL